MRRLNRTLLPGLTIAALILAMGPLLASLGTDHGPYQTALSNLAVVNSAMAAPSSCPNKQCSADQTRCQGQKGYICAIDHSTHRCKGNICL